MSSLFASLGIAAYVMCWTSYSACAGPSLARLLGIEHSIGAAGSELRASILASEQALMRIEQEFDQDVKHRIDQVDGIVSSALDKIDVLRQESALNANQLLDRANLIFARALIDAKELEKSINQDLSSLVFESECAVKRTIQEAIPETFSGIAWLLGGNKIVITPPVLYEGERREFCLGRCQVKESFDIVQPYSGTYLEVRDYMLNRLDQMPDDGPINSIVSTYEFLSSFSRRTACFFPRSEQRYISEHLRYQNIVEAWTTILGPELGMER